MDWRDRITFLNVRSFAWGAIRLYEVLEKLEARGFGTLVIPSRGTFPFTGQLFGIHQRWAEKRVFDNSVMHGLSTPFHASKITLPFTADTQLEDPSVGVSISGQIRDYWVRVLKAILAGDLSSPELHFYQYVQDQIFGIGVGVGASIRRPSSHFVFVDTVVSGRAVVEIDRSMREQGLVNVHYVLIVDNDAKSLSAEYRHTIKGWEASGKATLIPIENIFTEDRGPGLTGSWCLISPQLMSAGPTFLPGFSSSQVVGAAAGFIRVQYGSELDNMNMTRTNGALHFLLTALVSSELFQSQKGYAEYLYEDFIEELEAYSRSGFGPVDPRETLRIAKNAFGSKSSIAVMGRPITAVEDVDVSASHVIRVSFSEAEITRHVAAFKKLLSSGKQAFWYVHH